MEVYIMATTNLNIRIDKEIKDLKKQLALFDEEDDADDNNKNDYDISFSSF